MIMSSTSSKFTLTDGDFLTALLEYIERKEQIVLPRQKKDFSIQLYNNGYQPIQHTIRLVELEWKRSGDIEESEF